MYEIGKELTIEMGHRLPNHGGKCRNIHGHSYKLELFCASTTLHTQGAQEGMVEDFLLLKGAMDPIDTIFDHSLVLCIDDPMLPALMHLDNYEQVIRRMKTAKDMFAIISGVQSTKLIVIRHPPTAEVLGTVWLILMKRIFDESTRDSQSYITALHVKETATSSVMIHNTNTIDANFHALNYEERKPS